MVYEYLMRLHHMFNFVRSGLVVVLILLLPPPTYQGHQSVSIITPRYLLSYLAPTLCLLALMINHHSHGTKTTIIVVAVFAFVTVVVMYSYQHQTRTHPIEGTSEAFHRNTTSMPLSYATITVSVNTNTVVGPLILNTTINL